MSVVHALEQQLKAAKEAVELRDAALRLDQVADFRKVILKQFCVEDCARYAQLSADPSLKQEMREDSLALAQSAGHLRRYLSVLVQLGNQAANQIPEIEAAIVEAAQEGDE